MNLMIKNNHSEGLFVIYLTSLNIVLFGQKQKSKEEKVKKKKKKFNI